MKLDKEPAAKEKAESAATILQTVFGILDTEKMAERIGEITGAESRRSRESSRQP